MESGWDVEVLFVDVPAVTINANSGEILSEVLRSIFHAPMSNELTDVHQSRLIRALVVRLKLTDP